MSLSVEEQLKIKELPDFLRTEHCFNDMQHAMLVILFRHALLALRDNDMPLASKVIDNITVYLYIHFLNEEEGLAYKATRNLISREGLMGHSEQHIDFLEIWNHDVLLPFKNQTLNTQAIIESVSSYYNVIIQHIGEEDIPTYGPDSIDAIATRAELGRISITKMPMSPFMSSAYSTLKILAPKAAHLMDVNNLNPLALDPIRDLNLVSGVGRVLTGSTGSLRDRFAQATRGDITVEPDDSQWLLAA